MPPGRRPSRRLSHHHRERPSWPIPRTRVPLQSFASRLPNFLRCSRVRRAADRREPLSPIVGSPLLELAVRLCRGSCRSSGADARGVHRCLPPPSPLSSRWVLRKDALGQQRRRLRNRGDRHVPRRRRSVVDHKWANETPHA
ncbi:hypothetical protein HPB47_008540 [Ixodes persulcatus]|uniref:Uncharacterized protein n=1 Tax=Ixodes persulcatus TaxID=34615 RepID=A0AC60P4G7_IXOPE|nr:hypothetical protein HPB47_008540 [Ixodes persulcatus]